MRDPKILLTAEEMPRQWYILASDLPKPPPPPLGPDGQPVGPDALAPVFPMNLIEQEVCTDRWIDIPDGVLELLARYRRFVGYRIADVFLYSACVRVRHGAPRPAAAGPRDLCQSISK